MASIPVARLVAFAGLICIAYFLNSCYEDHRLIVIDDVTQEMSWDYDITTPPIIGERQFIVLIDGELDHDAVLESQHQIFTSEPTSERGKERTYMFADAAKLPKGKFSLVINQDDSGPVKFMYHPLGVRKGWVRIDIKPGQWNSRDSTRRSPNYYKKVFE